MDGSSALTLYREEKARALQERRISHAQLMTEANNGYIDTTAEIAQGASIKVTARDAIPARKFGYWLNISPLLYSNNPQAPATVGAPDPHDIVAHYNDIVVAFAFYNEVKQPLFVPPRDAFYDPWWWIKTLGGLVQVHNPGDQVTLRVLRGSSMVDLKVTLGDRPAGV